MHPHSYSQSGVPEVSEIILMEEQVFVEKYLILRRKSFYRYLSFVFFDVKLSLCLQLSSIMIEISPILIKFLYFNWIFLLFVHLIPLFFLLYFDIVLKYENWSIEIILINQALFDFVKMKSFQRIFCRKN